MRHVLTPVITFYWLASIVHGLNLVQTLSVFELGRRGENSREKARAAILLFAADGRKYKKSEFIKEIVEKERRFSKNTVYKYLDKLVDDGLMKMEPGSPEESYRPDFSITDKGLEAVKRIESHLLVDSLDTRWLAPLRNLLIRIKHESGELDKINSYCFAFIGDVPCAFTKSVEAMKSHIAFEKNLHQRHQRDLEKFREEFVQSCMKGDKASQARVEERIKEEVGWTMGEYLRKLLKKAEKEKGVRKIMTVLGITEDMLEDFA